MDPLDILEDRIAKMERRVFGHPNPSSAELPRTSAAESLIQTARTLTAAVTGHDKASNVLKRVKELNNLVEMSCEDSSTAAKLEIVLIKEADLYLNLAQLEHTRKLAASVLDNPQASENLKSVDGLSNRLDKLALLTANNVENYNTLSAQVQELFNRYNTIVNDLMGSFLIFNDMVSAKEAEAFVPKVLD